MKISHLCKSYKEQSVLKDISIESNLGQIIGLVGNNGSGKTTFMKCIAGLIVNYQGDIFSRGSISFAIDNPSFYDSLTVNDNLKVFITLAKKSLLDVDEVLKQVGLSEAKNKKYRQLSLGMKQKLSIARVLLSDSDIVLLDEPFNGLDVLTKEQLKELILMLRKQGKNIIISSHILEDLGEISDVIWYLEKGRIRRIINLNDERRVYNVTVSAASDVRMILSSKYNLFLLSSNQKVSVFRVELLQRDISVVLKTLVEAGVEVLEYRDCTNDIKELMLEEEKYDRVF